MAMVDLATRQTLGCECGPICLAEIAARQKLSLAYLEQLFGKLRRAGLVTSARGPNGGYRLARTSNAIAIADIVCAVDEPIRVTRCADGSPGCLDGAGRLDGDSPGDRPGDGPADCHEGPGRCQTHDLWEELGRQILLFLEGVTLADVVLGRVLGRAAPLTGSAAQKLAAE
jgi:Rrf2 family iron-sulfur cluster assembly transcriptional regulator